MIFIFIKIIFKLIVAFTKCHLENQCIIKNIFLFQYIFPVYIRILANKEHETNMISLIKFRINFSWSLLRFIIL